MAAPPFHLPGGAARAWLAPLLTALLCAAGLAWWRSADTLPPLADEAENLRACLRWQSLLDAPLRERPRLVARRLASDSPPFLFAAAGPLRACGRGARAAVNAAFSALLIASVFGIGEALYGEKTGAAACALAASYPLALCLPRYFLPWTAATALAAATVYSALRAERSRRLSWHLAMGLAFGAGTLSSVLFPLFALPPIACIFFAPRRTLRYRGPAARRSCMLAAAAAAAAAVAGPWCALHAGGWRFAFTRPSPAGLLRFASHILDSALFIPMAALFLAGLASTAARRRAEPSLLAWFFAPLLGLGLFGVSDPRLFAPALPAAALITAAGIAMIGHRAARAGLAAAAALFCVLNAAALSIRLPGGPIDLSIPIGRGGARAAFARSIISAGEMGPPRRENWRLDEIMRDIAGEAGAGTVPLGWVIAPHPRFNRSTILYSIEAAGCPAAEAPLRDAELILIRLVTDAQRTELRRLTEPWLRLDRLAAYPLPDGSRAELDRAWLTRRRGYRARDLQRDTGETAIADTEASTGWARYADRNSSPPGALLKGPGHALDPGDYRLAVRMRCSGAKPGVPLARIEARAGGALLASLDLAPPAGVETIGYRQVGLEFSMPRRGPFDALVIHTGNADLWIDTVSIEPRVR